MKYKDVRSGWWETWDGWACLEGARSRVIKTVSHRTVLVEYFAY